MEPKAAAGRRLLFQAERRGDFPRLGEPDWDDINDSLALYDTLGGYVLSRTVDRDTVLRAWHHPLTNIAGPVRRFMAHREAQGVNQPWAYLMQLLALAEAYPCQCPRASSEMAQPALPARTQLVEPEGERSD